MNGPRLCSPCAWAASTRVRLARAATALLASAGLFAGGSSSACAAEPAAVVGIVKTVVGEAWVGEPGLLERAVPGTSVRVGATLKTGAGASMGVTLKDNTVMALGPGSEARVDDFLFDPDAREGRLAASLLRGTLNFVSGLIAKLRPDAQVVRTPTATLGIRGTHFAVKVDEPAP